MIAILTTPRINNISVFDAKEEKRITFDVIGGNQVVSNTLVIERLSDNVEVYRAKQDAFNLYHILPARTLINGVDYRAKIQTTDVKGNDSEFSSGAIFWVFSRPLISIDNIAYDDMNRIYNQTWIFKATYEQSEHETVQSYRYLIYDDNKVLIKSFPEKFLGSEKEMTQEIAGLQHGETYHVEVKTLSANNNSGTSGLILVRPFYVAPKVNAVVTTTPLPDKGAIKISANIVQIVMRLYDNTGKEVLYEDIDYMDGTSINLNRWDYQTLVADKGFDIVNGDFMLKLWVKDITGEKNVLSIFNETGQIDVFRKRNRIHAYKSLRGLSIKDYYASEPYTIVGSQEVMIVVRQEDDTMDIQVHPL